MLPVTRYGDQIGSLKEFYKRRAMRILPPYYVTLVLSIVFIALFADQATSSIWDINLPLKADTIIAHFLLLQNIPFPMQGGMINYPLWSIATEFQIYLLMPLIVWSLRKFGEMCTLTCTLSLAGLHFALHGKLDNMVPWYLGLFTMGAIGARLCILRQSKINPRFAWISSALLILIILASFKKGALWIGSHFYLFDLLVGAATALLLCTAYTDSEKQENAFTRFVSWKPLVTVGKFSYSLYLIHAPMLHFINIAIVRAFHMTEMQGLITLLLSIPIIVFIAYGFFYAFEAPFISRRAVAAPMPLTDIKSSSSNGT